MQTLQVIIGFGEGTLDANQHTQVGLPTRHGGLEVHLPTRTCILARVASLTEHGPTLRAAIRRRLPNADAHNLDGIDAALAEGIREKLAALGIMALGPGVHRSMNPRTPLSPNSSGRTSHSATCSHFSRSTLPPLPTVPF